MPCGGGEGRGDETRRRADGTGGDRGQGGFDDLWMGRVGCVGERRCWWWLPKVGCMEIANCPTWRVARAPSPTLPPTPTTTTPHTTTTT